MIKPYLGNTPQIESAHYIAPSATLIGEVVMGAGCSVWENVTIRGDVASITIGERTTIKDGVVVHVNEGVPTVVGDDVFIGHGAIIHGCTLENGCVIGMGAIILDRSVIGEHSLVAPGALVPPRKTYPPRSLIVGSPAKVARTLTDEEVANIKANAEIHASRGLPETGPTGNG